MNIRESIETIGVKRLSELAGVTMATVDRTKIRGAFSSRPAGARIRQAIRDEGLKLEGDDGGEQPDLPAEEALSTRLRKEDLAWKSERARGVRMKNDEAEGLFVAGRRGQGAGQSSGRGVPEGAGRGSAFDRGGVLRWMPGCGCGRIRRGDERDDHRRARGIGGELMSCMEEKPNWPRVRITVVPCPPGLTPEQLNEVVLAMCQRFWDAGKITRRWVGRRV